MSLHFLCKSAFYHHFRWVSYRLFCAKPRCFSPSLQTTRTRSQSLLNVSFYCMPFAWMKLLSATTRSCQPQSSSGKTEEVDDSYLSGPLVSSLLGLASIRVGNPLLMTRLFSVQNHSLSNLIHHEWMNHQLNNWFLLIPKTNLGCDTSHYFFQVDHLVGWIKRNQKDSIRIIFLSDFWVPIALIHFFDSGIKRNQMFEWAVFTQLKTA